MRVRLVGNPPGTHFFNALGDGGVQDRQFVQVQKVFDDEAAVALVGLDLLGGQFGFHIAFLVVCRLFVRHDTTAQLFHGEALAL